MSIYTTIKSELDSNVPLYGALTDQQVADELNVVDKPVQRDSIPGAELFGYTDETEYNALTDAKKTEWLSLCAIDTITKDATPIIKGIFNNTTTTWANIVAAATVNVSRASQIGLGRVRVGDVTNARAI